MNKKNKKSPDVDLSLALLAAAIPKKDSFLEKVRECPTSIAPYIHGWEPVKAWVVCGAYVSVSKQKRQKSSNHHTVYHGTPSSNVASIVATKFRLPNHNGMFGKAVYLTPDPAKAIGYTGSYRKKAYILVCRVNLGRVCTATEAMPELDLETIRAKGYDSVMGVAGKTMSYSQYLRHSEYAVYDPRRIEVSHIVEYIPQK